MPIAIYVYHQVGQCVHVVRRGQVYDTQCSLPLSLCLCLLRPVYKPHFPRDHLSHFLHFSLWSCVLTLTNIKIHYILNVPSIPLSLCLCLTLASHISPRGYLPYFLWSCLLTSADEIPHLKIIRTVCMVLNSDSETLGITLVAHKPTYTS